MTKVSGAIRRAIDLLMEYPRKLKMPRGIGLTYDGMRRCQRLPELRTPLIPRDAEVCIKPRTRAICGIFQQNAHS
jgi:hypothetical protein